MSNFRNLSCFLLFLQICKFKFYKEKESLRYRGNKDISTLFCIAIILNVLIPLYSICVKLVTF